MNEEKSKILIELQDLQNSVTELEVKCQHHLTDKRELRASLSEIQKNNSVCDVIAAYNCNGTNQLFFFITRNVLYVKSMDDNLVLPFLLKESELDV